MSVDKRRLAAAQRTAALKTTSTTKRLCAWIIIVPALALFSFSVVAGAAGFGAKPDFAAAAAKVTPKHADDHGSVVVVESSKGSDNPVAGLFGKGVGHQVCWISGSQLTRVSASVPHDEGDDPGRANGLRHRHASTERTSGT